MQAKAGCISLFPYLYMGSYARIHLSLLWLHKHHIVAYLLLLRLVTSHTGARSKTDRRGCNADFIVHTDTCIIFERTHAGICSTARTLLGGIELHSGNMQVIMP